MPRPLVQAVLCLIGGIALAQWIRFSFTLAAVAAVAVLAAGVLGHRHGWVFTRWLIMGSCFALGVFWTTNAAGQNQTELEHWLHTHLNLTGEVIKGPEVYSDRTVYTLRARELEQEGRRLAVNEKVLVVSYAPVSSPSPSFRYRDLVRVHGQLERPPGRRNPGEFDYQAYLSRQGIFARMVVVSAGDMVLSGHRDGFSLVAAALAAKERMVRLVQAELPGSQAGVLLALLFGDKEQLDEGQIEAFTTLGLMHLMAVSGFNVVFVWLILAGIARLLKISSHSRTGMAIIFAGLVLHAIITGLTPSVLRATVMALVLLVARQVDRDYDVYSSLALAAGILLLVNPFYLADVGFQLSFVATLGLVYLSGVVAECLPFLPWGRNLLSVPLAAQLALMPLMALYFNLIPGTGILANVLVGVLMGPVVILGLVALLLAVLIPLAAVYLVQTAGAIIKAVLILLPWLERMPGTAIQARIPRWWEIILYYLFLVMAREVWVHRHSIRLKEIWSRFGPAVLAAALAAGMTAFALALPGKHAQMLEVTFLDVGQGSAIYIRTPRGARVLVDGGGRTSKVSSYFDVGKEVVVPYLVRQGVGGLELVVSTHPDGDHLNGLFAVLSQLHVHQVATPPVSYHGREYSQFGDAARAVPGQPMELVRGEAVLIDPDVSMSVLGPGPPLEGTSSDSNNNSLVLKLTYGRTSFLLPGDVEGAGMESLAALGGDQLKSTIFLVPHHGSRYGLNERFLASVDPSAVVIQVGKNNSFGHPAPEVLKYWDLRQVTVYRTDLDGAVTIRTDGENWWTRTIVQRDPKGRKTL